MLQSPSGPLHRSPSPHTDYNKFLNPADLSGYGTKYAYSPSEKKCIHFCFIHLIANYDNKSRTGSPVRSRLYMGIHYQVILTYLLDPNERAEMEV